jgi:cytochrome d ubiquinol oxidase subunit II
MILNEVWFILFIGIIAGYLILDGFDMGVGILHLPLARNDVERRTMLGSIGPVWDGNEVWLVLGGGVLFAVFPLAYASIFSGFYIAFMGVLTVLILRAVTIEFRSQRSSPRWRSAWDVAFAATSAGLAFLLGVTFGNLLAGVPLDASGDIHIDLVGMLSPFTILVGVTTVAMFAMHGAIYLVLKTEGELLVRIRRAIPWLMTAFLVLNTLVIVGTLTLDHDITLRYVREIWPIVLPAGALGAFAGAWYFIRRDQPLRAFTASSLMIGLLLLAASAGLFPNLIISTIDVANNLTIYNAASEANTLQVALIITLIGMPFVLLYTSGVYYIFRGKTEVDPEGY